MIELLSHWLIRNRENTGDPAVRLAYGRLCGLVGIGLNLLLFGGKLFACLHSRNVHCEVRNVGILGKQPWSWNCTRRTCVPTENTVSHEL